MSDCPFHEDDCTSDHRCPWCRLDAVSEERDALAARCERLRRVAVAAERSYVEHRELYTIIVDALHHLDDGDLEPPATGAGEKN